MNHRSPESRGPLRRNGRPNLPTLVSLSRIPLAVAFTFVVGEPALACAILLAAGASDVLDGWLARRRHETSTLGLFVDPVADKFFVLTAAFALVRAERLVGSEVARLAARELFQLPIASFGLARRCLFADRKVAPPGSSYLGKAATTLQFVALVGATAGAGWLDSALWSAMVAGLMAATSYALQELRPKRDQAR